MDERLIIEVTGTVQGVGFRPFVYHLAAGLNLTGQVRNTSRGVVIEVQGPSARLTDFLAAMEKQAPPQARINSVSTHSIPPSDRGAAAFEILPSADGGDVSALVPPDLATCEACLAEVASPLDRRFSYPFTNCTNCGPRFTIIKALPYDRPNTTMYRFPLCDDCAAEYDDPEDRRFHAQPVACPRCGPKLSLWRPDAETGTLTSVSAKDPLAEIRRAIMRGQIVAVKGLGGFHLVCDAADTAAVTGIRRLKERSAKPFAIMCPGLAWVKDLCEVPAEEEELLTSTAGPIVILRRRMDSPVRLAVGIASGQDTLGVMLPYTPLHQLLMQSVDRPLVMTSANPGDEPMIKEDSEFGPELARGLRFVLSHNRPIHARCDDSVWMGGETPFIIRRARGYVPAPLTIIQDGETMGIGADTKNAACFLKARQAYLTQHIGDVGGGKTAAALREAMANLREILGLAPVIVACDMHPGYTSREIAYTLGLPILEVQHHHAHIASCLGENLAAGPAIGVALDGTGYSPDGTVWGGEFLWVEGANSTRLASLLPVLLPGGEKAVREPWRMATAYLYSTYGHDWPDFPGGAELCGLGADLLLPALDQRLNSPWTSSAGRLFDAFSALLGLMPRPSFEGEAAMALEVLARQGNSVASPYAFGIETGGLTTCLDFRPTVGETIRDLRGGRPAAEIARRFHLTVAYGVAEVCKRIRVSTGCNLVALSGGVYQNTMLLAMTLEQLTRERFEVLHHKLVPPNDGGIALGQALIAAASLAGNQ